MPDTQTSDQPFPVTEADGQRTPTVAMDEEQAMLRVSRKREREVSIEPHTPQSDAGDLPSTQTEPRERKLPLAKKNRLDSVDELESPPHSPPLPLAQAVRPKQPIVTPSTPPNNSDYSPPIDSVLTGTAGEPPRLQHLREKVEDLNWKDKASPMRGITGHSRPKSIYDTTMGEPDPEEEEPEPAKTPTIENQAGRHGEDTVIDDASSHEELRPDDVNIGSPLVAPVLKTPTQSTPQDAEVIAPFDPLLDQVPVNDISPLGPPVTLAQDIPKKSAHNRRRSDGAEATSDAERSSSPSRKRKLITRASTFANDSKIQHEESSKRQRDEDGLPKAIPETSEDSQTPTEEAPKPPPAGEKPTPASPPPKSTGFAAFSGASPFSKVGGPGVSALTASKPSGSPTSSTPKSFMSGFGSFMSNASPFASIPGGSSWFGASSTSKNEVEGQRAASPPPPPAFGTATQTNRSRSPSTSSLNRRKSPPPAGTKPKPGAAFGSYNSSSFGFGSTSAGGFGTRQSPTPSSSAVAVPARKTTVEGQEPVHAKENGDAEEAALPSSLPTAGESMKRGANWNEMLGSGGDGENGEDGGDKKKLKVEEIEVTTGEEEEDTRHSIRSRLYFLDSTGQYKERGVGVLKLNVRKSDGSGPRLLMRAEAIHRLILNAALFHGMSISIAQDPKFIKVTSLDNGKPQNWLIKVNSPKAAQELYSKIMDHVPSSDDHDSPQEPAGEV